MSKQSEIDDAVAAFEEKLKGTIMAMYVPARNFQEATDVISPNELLYALKRESGMELSVASITEAMSSAGFLREAVGSKTYWLIKYA